MTTPTDHHVHGIEDIRAAVARARNAGRSWAARGPRERRTVVVNPVRDMDEAVERVNASAYSLGAAVFTRSRAAGLAVAGRLDSGAVSVNSVLGFAAIPALPFGGAGESGYGRIHGEEGLRAFAAPHSVTVRRFAPAVDLTSFTTPRAKAARAVELGRKLHARF